MSPTTPKQASIERTVVLNLSADWGGANFHRIQSWLTQEFCSRAGPRSRTGIWSLRDGGLDALTQVFYGECHASIMTPAAILPAALTGEGIFAATGPMPSLRALAVLPQRDRMMFAVDPEHGVKTFEDIRRAKLPLRIVTSQDNGTNFIGYTAMRIMEAHGIDKATLESWGGRYEFGVRPDDCIDKVVDGTCDALVQEAIMTPWWSGLIEGKKFVPIPFESQALEKLKGQHGFEPAVMPAGFWKGIDYEITTSDFADFLLIVRDDLPEDIAYLLTWCLVETRHLLEAQYSHIPPEKSPLTYPLDPYAMAKPTLPLHPGAERYYREAGYLS